MRQFQHALAIGLLATSGLVICADRSAAQEKPTADRVAAVKVGDRAPDFKVASEDETTVGLDSYLKQHELLALVFVRAHW